MKQSRPMNIKKYAEQKQVTRRTVENWLRVGKVKGEKVGRDRILILRRHP